MGSADQCDTEGTVHAPSHGFSGNARSTVFPCPRPVVARSRCQGCIVREGWLYRSEDEPPPPRAQATVALATVAQKAGLRSLQAPTAPKVYGRLWLLNVYFVRGCLSPTGGGDSAGPRTPTTPAPPPPPPRGLRPTVSCQRCRPQASTGA